MSKQQNCIYLGDLHESVKEKDLSKVFSDHGSVSNVMIFCAVLRKKYAQVEMVDQEAGMFLFYWNIF